MTRHGGSAQDNPMMCTQGDKRPCHTSFLPRHPPHRESLVPRAAAVQPHDFLSTRGSQQAGPTFGQSLLPTRQLLGSCLTPLRSLPKCHFLRGHPRPPHVQEHSFVSHAPTLVLSSSQSAVLPDIFLFICLLPICLSVYSIRMYV